MVLSHIRCYANLGDLPYPHVVDELMAKVARALVFSWSLVCLLHINIGHRIRR